MNNLIQASSDPTKSTALNLKNGDSTNFQTMSQKDTFQF